MLENQILAINNGDWLFQLKHSSMMYNASRKMKNINKTYSNKHKLGGSGGAAPRNFRKFCNLLMKILYFLSDFSIIVHLFFIPDSRPEHRPEHVRNALNFSPFLHWPKIFRGGNVPAFPPPGYATDGWAWIEHSIFVGIGLINSSCFLKGLHS